MYLKSIQIKNFRKFGSSNNEIILAESGDYKINDDKEINIAPKTTLIIGKNNSGKTTVVDALNILINESAKFSASDFNFAYLKSLLELYNKDKDNIQKNLPHIEFVIKIGIDNKKSTDILSRLYQVISIDDVHKSECTLTLRYQIKESVRYIEKVKTLLEKEYSSIQFNKFLHLLDETTFIVEYFNKDGDRIDEFKLSNLIEMTYIRANNIRGDKCLTSAFSRIVEYKYKNNLETTGNDILDSDLDNVNETLSKYFAENHTGRINNVIKNFIDSKKCQVLLKADLTVKALLSSIVQYYFIEDENEVPEDQFGLGYTNLIMIVAQILEYMEKYPNTAYNSQINIIAIEEPETFMHPQMQENFIKDINVMIGDLINDNKKNINSQIIITTHSPHIVNSKIHTGGTFNSINYFKDNKGNVKTIALRDENLCQYTKVEGKKIEIAKANNKISELDKPLQEKYHDFEFIKKHIKYTLSEVFFADALILVEGQTEFNLLKYYIDLKEELRKKHISVVQIDGCHAKMYEKLIKVLDIPTLIITDLDIKRSDKEKGGVYIDDKGKGVFEYCQISDLSKRETTNKTLKEFRQNKYLSNTLDYIEDGNIKLVYQKDKISGYYATSFEEAFFLENANVPMLKNILVDIFPSLKKMDSQGIISRSYELQKKISSKKMEFANKVLFEEMNKDEQIFNLPKYIEDGISFIKSELGE